MAAPLAMMAAAVANSDNHRHAAAKRHQRLATTCALFLALAAPATAAHAQWTPMSGQVIRAIDGDSIEVKIGARAETVRYAGINTPEILHPSRGLEPYRAAAKAANARLAAGKHVQLVFDVEPRDRTGRLLAYVYAQDTLLNAELVALGYAEVVTCPPNVRNREAFMTRQREARLARRGLWADPEAAKYHRPRHAGVFGDRRLLLYFHPDDGGRHLLYADPFVHFESPQQAAAAGYRPSMDYASFVRREQRFLSGAAMVVGGSRPQQ